MAVNINPRPVVYSENATLKGRHFTVESLIVQTGSGKTFTLPTPTKDLAGKPTKFCNYGTGNLTLSGAFAGGSSYTVATKITCDVVCLPVAALTYKWHAIGGSQASIAYGLVGVIAATGATSTATAAGTEASAAHSDHVHGLAAHTHADATHGGAVAHTVLSSIGTNTHAQLDTFVGTTVPAYFNTTTGHDHDGVDSALLPITSLVGSLEWTTWSPTLAWGTATPTVTTVARYKRVHNTIFFELNITTADGLNATFTSASLPVTPKDIDAFVPVQGIALVTATYTTFVAEIDAETGTSGNRKLYARSTTVMTNAAACRLSFTGSYEVIT